MRRFSVPFQILLSSIPQLRMYTVFKRTAERTLVLIDVLVSTLVVLKSIREEFTLTIRTLKPSGSVEGQKVWNRCILDISVGDYVFIDGSLALKLTLKIQITLVGFPLACYLCETLEPFGGFPLSDTLKPLVR